MAVLLSDEEIQALNGLPHLHYVLYIAAIRRYMDYKTGIVGVKRGISYQSLSEEVYIKGERGIKQTLFSHAQIRRALNQLEKVGLIARKSIITKDEKRLILECLLARKDNSVQNKVVPTPSRPPVLEVVGVENQESTVNIGIKDTLENESSFYCKGETSSKAVPPPVSGKDHIISYQGESEIFEQIGEYRTVLIDIGFGINEVSHIKTITMLHAFKREGVLPEDMKLVLEAHRANSGGLLKHPTYYLGPIMKARAEKEQILDNVEKAKNEPIRQPRRGFETEVERALRLIDEAEAAQK